tara:strand:- start:113 stop:1036 length:924 start_codon:yes stop_codon:yes gene_type:complete
MKKESAKKLSLGNLKVKHLKEISVSEAQELIHNIKEKIKSGLNNEEIESSIHILIEGLGDTRGRIRRKYSNALSEIGLKVIPALTYALNNHSNLLIRRSAAKTLRLFHNINTLPSLVKALTNDLDPVVQGSSAAAIAVFGEEALELLINVLINPNSTAMQSGLASWGISYIGNKTPHGIRKAAYSAHKKVRTAAIAALGEQINNLDCQEDKDLIISALNDSCENVRSEAIILVGKFTNSKLAETLIIPKLEDSSIEVKKNAALTLMRMNSKEGLSALRNIEKKESDIYLSNIFMLAVNNIESDIFTN